MAVKKPRKKTGKKIAALSISAIVFCAVSLLHFLSVFQYLENRSYDLRVRMIAPLLRPSDEIIVILVNQDSIDWAQRERGWPWPWPRQAYAEMIDYISLGRAKSISFDLIYSEPSIHGTEDDEAFIRASEESGKVVQGIFFSSQFGSYRSWPPELEAPLFETAGFGDFLDRFGMGGAGSEFIGSIFPIQGLRDTAAALGCLSGIHDFDHIYRRLRLFTIFDGKPVPGLAAAALIAGGHGTETSYNPHSMSIQWDDIHIPVDNSGSSLLRFRGSLDRYHPFTARNVLLSAEAYKRGEEPIHPPEDFTEGYVFVGVFAPGLFDIFSSPISSVYPGIGMHITMLDNMLTGDFIRESREWLNLMILFIAISLTVALCLFSRSVLLPICGAIVLILGTVGAAFAAYRWNCLWLPMIKPLAGIVIGFISTTLYNYATEGRQKRFITSAFSQYLSPKVIEQIIADPSQLKLGGEKREMTAIFSDVRGFSTIAEALGDPEKLVELLNHYLTRMSNIIIHNDGTIDKYEGDSIIAFFGAPVHYTNHASLACRSAVAMKKAEAAINREALTQGLIPPEVFESKALQGIMRRGEESCPLFTRMGINTGEMVVGNMGTPRKMDYTIMGNAVNLAARLEGVNKQYQTGGTLISEYTRDHIGEEFILRPLSRVRVVGISTPIRLYELLDTSEDAPPALLNMVEKWEQGFALYEHRDFFAAKNTFEAIFQDNVADHVAEMYYNRCNKYIAVPPDEELWDGGIDTLTEK